MTNGWTYALCFALNGCGQQGRFSKQQLNYTLIINNEWWGAGVVICLKRGADLHMAQLMPLPLTVSCSVKIQIGFTFLVPAHPGNPGQRAVKHVCEHV